MADSTLTAALNPPRAHGAPISRGVLRAEPEDFVVEEDLGFTASGSGQHVLLKVRKRDANTQWVARELARACGCRPHDVGYAGLKDRRAIAIQWFSVPKSTSVTLEAWAAVAAEGFEVVEAHAHSRKLPRGALAGNRFHVRIRSVEADDASLAARIDAIARRGVPNYFGPQRFGRGGSNLARIPDDPRSLRPPERGFVLSAARSVVFNAVAAERVLDGTWETLEVGDIANLDGRGSVFAVEADESTDLVARCARLDVHATGPLWGLGALTSGGRVNALESDVAARFSRECSLVEHAGMDQERRALRLAVRELEWSRDSDVVSIRFRLGRGSFATTVLREIVDGDSGEEGDG
jgi:tRNA pseudouridine13 synthase